MGFLHKNHYQISSYLNNTQIPSYSNININDHLHFDSSLLEGWFVDFIISGDFVHNVLNKFNSNEINFMVFTEKGFHTLLFFFYKMTNHITFSITQESIDLNIYGYPYKVKLFNRIDWSIYQCMESYYYDYKKCFYDGQYIKISPECYEMMNEKKIYIPSKGDDIYYKDIFDAVTKGYKFKKEFLVSAGIENIKTEEIVDENIKYIGQRIHDINNTEIEILEKLVKDNHQYENDHFHYIFTIHDSLEIIIILLPFVCKNPPVYKNICCCSYCDSEVSNMYDEEMDLPLTFYNIINFLYDNTFGLPT